MTDKHAASGPGNGTGNENGSEGENGSPRLGEGDAAAGGDREQLELALREAEENREKYLRAMAELDNVRKRMARELEGARKFGAERLVSALLPVRDSLEASLEAAAGGQPDAQAMLDGDRATLRILVQILADAGVSEIDPEGEPFDPARHEAISMLPSPTAEPNSVVSVVQKGYLLHDRVVRPARVVVATAPPSAEGT